jgi:integrase
MSKYSILGMTEQKQKRCLTMFIQAIGSPETKKSYLYHLGRFLKWNELTDYDDLLKADEKAIQRNLEDYLIHLKDSYSANYIPTMITPIELFYVMNDVNLNSKRLHKMYPTKTKSGGYGAYTGEMISVMLETSNKKRTRALILFLSSSGCRVGVIPELKLKHITNIENCKKILCYADTKDEYTTFMTPEASKSFDDYLEERQQDQEKLNPESPAFRKSYRLGYAPSETMETGTVKAAINVTLKNIPRTKKGHNFNIPMVHGFRKYFNVTMKTRHDCNLSLCEKMIGHSTTIPMDNHYGTFTEEMLFEEYKKAIPELTISPEERQLIQLETKNEELTKLEQLKIDNNELKELREHMKDRDELAKIYKDIASDKAKVDSLTSRLEEALESIRKEKEKK